MCSFPLSQSSCVQWAHEWCVGERMLLYLHHFIIDQISFVIHSLSYDTCLRSQMFCLSLVLVAGLPRWSQVKKLIFRKLHEGFHVIDHVRGHVF